MVVVMAFVVIVLVGKYVSYTFDENYSKLSNEKFKIKCLLNYKK